MIPTRPEAARYCPQCNRPTPIEVSRYPPFVAVACRECGHVHRISEEFRMPPILIPGVKS